MISIGGSLFRFFAAVSSCSKRPEIARKCPLGAFRGICIHTSDRAAHAAQEARDG